MGITAVAVNHGTYTNQLHEVSGYTHCGLDIPTATITGAREV
jgi:hypothetical protein